MKLIGSLLWSVAVFLAVSEAFIDVVPAAKTARRSFLLSAAKKPSPFFLDSNDDSTTPMEPTPPKTPPPSVATTSSSTDSITKEKLQQVGEALKKELVDPLLTGHVEKNVPAHVIQGAALTGASLTLLAGQSLALTGMAGLGAAYVALSPGMGGKAVRAVGGAAWESASAAAELYEKYGMGPKLSQATKTMVMSTVDAIQKQKEKQQASVVAEEEKEKAAEEQEAARKADLYRIAAEKKQAEAKLGKQQKTVEKQKGKEVTETEEKKKAKAKRKAVFEQAKQEVQEEKEKDAKLAAEQKRLQRVDQEKQKKEEEAEKARLAEKMRIEDEARLKEEARKREEARKLEEERLKGDIAVEQDDDLEATIKLAETILDGTIAGLDDAITDTNAKEEWDSAGRLAQDLGKGPSAQEQAQEDDDVETLSDEEDMETLAQAAREAVAKFEEEMKNQDATKAKQKELWDSEMVTNKDFDYNEDLEELREEYDDEEDEDMEELQEELSAQDLGAGDVDLDELGRKAREAVAKFNVQEADTDDHETVTDWSKFTVAQLRTELKSRGLKTTGKKADLVAVLTNDDFDSQVQEEATGEGIMWDADLVEEPTMEDIEEATQDEPDVEEMARAAREAVELFEQQQANSVDVDSSVEYETMTVNELKDELRNRGLKISGKKAELIERLRSSS